MVIGLAALTFAASRSCQQNQVRITKEQAIETAERRIDFDPTRVQVRFLRQGINSRPTWVVSLSVPFRGASLDAQRFRELALVSVNANTGKVVSVKMQR